MRISRRIRTHVRTNVVGYIALFCFAMSGTAIALDGQNTVFSDDIVNGEVKAPDLGADAVGTGKIANGQVLSPDVRNESLTGSDVADGTLGGADVNESTLGQVPSALLGGIGAWNSVNSCDPGDNLFTCVFTTIDMPRQAPVLLIGTARGRGLSGGLDLGSCYLATHLGDLPASGINVDDDEQGTLIGVTDPVGPGPIDFGVRCNQFAGNMTYDQVDIAAVALAAD